MSQLEAQRSPYLVRFSQKQPHDFLTKAMHLPDMVAHAVGFVLDNQHLVRNDPAFEPSTPQKALLLGWERDTKAVAHMIGVVTLLSVLTGVLVGASCRSVLCGSTCDLAVPVIGEACNRIGFHRPVHSMKPISASRCTLCANVGVSRRRENMRRDYA
jgi:hypothetical protein